ncbi:MAG: 6-phosphogluconolactonase [Candidatus Bipolaricaulota bacterium]|nr:6-phosphogluconolactonase [Candidatus Bipolaricaulota bacterium]MBS3791398.1 6-phosphogluconolactonase [Candidatus Bipolaricaulota bacterium]
MHRDPEKEIVTIRVKGRKDLARKVAEKFYESLGRLLSSKDKVVVSLAGGRSVQSFYERIPGMADLLSGGDWRRVHFFWTDERLVPPGSYESNYGLAEDLFLGELMGRDLVRPDQIHRFPGETSGPSRALKSYRDDLEKISNGVIHLPVLGVGGDGHVGSLFPGSAQLNENSSEFSLVEASPKPPKERVTISPRLIRESKYPFLFFIGEEKREAYECFRAEATTYSDCPCKLAFSGSPGVCYVVTDLD